MLNKTLKLVIVFLFSLELTSLHAQVAIPASGGNATGSGTVSYSVGQVVYTTNSNSGSVAQGVQQPYEISVVTGLEAAKGISLEINVYPNPATDYIKLKIENYEIENLSYQLYDINGNVLLSNKIESAETNISMQTLLTSTYFLKVLDGNKVVKTFKVIKN